MPRPSDHKPNLPPSYDLHVLPSQIEGTGDYRGMDFWSLQGFDLKGVISVLYNINPFASHSPPRWTTAGVTISRWFCRSQKIRRECASGSTKESRIISTLP